MGAEARISLLRTPSWMVSHKPPWYSEESVKAQKEANARQESFTDLVHRLHKQVKELEIGDKEIHFGPSEHTKLNKFGLPARQKGETAKVPLKTLIGKLASLRL